LFSKKHKQQIHKEDVKSINGVIENWCNSSVELMPNHIKNSQTQKRENDKN